MEEIDHWTPCRKNWSTNYVKLDGVNVSGHRHQPVTSPWHETTPIEMDFRLKALSNDQGSNQPSFSSPDTHTNSIFANLLNFYFHLLSLWLHFFCLFYMHFCFDVEELTLWCQGHTFSVHPWKMFLDLSWREKGNFSSSIPTTEGLNTLSTHTITT